MKQYKVYFFSVFMIAVMAVMSPFVWKKLWESGQSNFTETTGEFQAELPETSEPIAQDTASANETQPAASTAVPALSTESETETQTQQAETIPAVTASPETQTQQAETIPAVTTPPETQTLPPETISTTEEERPSSSFVQGDANYFSDALFIGDSRTVGLSEYGSLKNSDYFANIGMNVYNVRTVDVSVPSVGKVTLEELLSAKSYGKIYMMLGINELGYDFNQTVRKYTDTVAWLREKQPDALIFIEANLHVTKKRSDKDAVFNNNAINRFNDAIAQLADRHSIFYIDINELFDDENGNLRQEYSGDNTHVYGKYYADWCIWLCTKTIQ